MRFSIFAAGTVQLLVKGPRWPAEGIERSHGKAWIFAFGQLLGFRHDAPRALPGIMRSIGELGEYAGCLFGLLV